ARLEFGRWSERVPDFDAQRGVRDGNVAWDNAQSLGLDESLGNVLYRHVQTQRVHRVFVDANGNVDLLRAPELLHPVDDIADVRLFDSRLDEAGSVRALLVLQRAADDWRTNLPTGIDDFFDSRDTLRDAHPCHTSKVKGL